jgi:hypothetical protein
VVDTANYTMSADISQHCGERCATFGGFLAHAFVVNHVFCPLNTPALRRLSPQAEHTLGRREAHSGLFLEFNRSATSFSGRCRSPHHSTLESHGVGIRHDVLNVEGSRQDLKCTRHGKASGALYVQGLGEVWRKARVGLREWSDEGTAAVDGAAI